MYVSDLLVLKGKLIEWMSPSDSSNTSDYGGIGVITDIVDGKKPIKYQSVIGDELNFAFKHTTVQGTLLRKNLCYSDKNSHIQFRVIQCTWGMYTDLKDKGIEIGGYHRNKLDLYKIYGTEKEVSYGL